MGSDLPGTRFVAGAAVGSRPGSAILKVEACGANPDVMSMRGEQGPLGRTPCGLGQPMGEWAGPGRRRCWNHVV